MCACLQRIQHAFNAVSIKDGDILLIDARVIDPEQLQYLRIAGITKPISVICVLPPPGEEVNLKDAMKTIDVAQLREVVENMERALAKEG